MTQENVTSITDA